MPTARRRLAPALLLLPVLVLAACGPQGGYGYGVPPSGTGATAIGEVPQRFYPPPGPPEDPWGPYIREAAARYYVPEQWIRAVMQQESGGQEQAVSPVGAMGLMQVMPETYLELQERYGLGSDPFDPHNNILAGTAYIHEMYDLFGSPGFLAGYNAGPDRVDSYLARTSRLPSETVNYIAAVVPNLGDALPPSGPFARYAAARPYGGPRGGASVASLAAGCDLNAAYDPNHPCTSLERAAVSSEPVQQALAPQAGMQGCDLGAAYDPGRPCRPMPQAAPRIQLAFNADYVAPRIRAERVAAAGSAARYRSARHPSAFPAHDWAVQVGAFKNPALARAIAEGARRQAPGQLRTATLTLPPTPSRGAVLYRARLAHLSEKEAASACTHLNRRQLPCVVVRPNRS